MTDSHTSTNTEEVPKQSMASRGESCSRRPDSDVFREFMSSDWGLRITKGVERCGAADYLPQRAAKAGRPLAGEHLAIPAGTYKVRNNDCTYRFRVYNAFVHLSSLGGKHEPDSVLVLGPKENSSYEAVLYFEPRASRSAQEFYSDPQYREFWVGTRPSLEEVHQEVDLRYVHIGTLPDAPAKDAKRVKLRIVREVDTSIKTMVNEIREQAEPPFGEEVRSADEAFKERLSETRLRRGTFELVEPARAVGVTRASSEGIMRALPRAVGHRRGKCVVGGVFGAVAREEGNGLGCDTIAAPSNHANTLRWVDGDRPVNEGDLVLIDAGVKVDSLYTADIAHTLPVNGRFTGAQARIYQAVLDTCEAALARTNKPGTRSHDVRDVAIFVVATRLRKWGLLPVSVEKSLPPAGQQHRRWMPRGTSHHPGLDTHDYTQAYRGMYRDALLEPGMIFTIEPGLYFHVDGKATPTECRDIGVHIENDVVVNEDGSVTRTSENIPRAIDDVEA